jgi:hypothetical protein
VTLSSLHKFSRFVLQTTRVIFDLFSERSSVLVRFQFCLLRENT